ncbi:MAG TPA: RHS repeat-associated core domain-containing protein [Solimonas sp.]
MGATLGRLLGVGLLFGISGLSSAAWAATVTRTSAFVYDGNGKLIKEVIEPGNSNLCVASTSVYDIFGNKTSGAVRNCNGSALATGSEAAAPTGDAAFAPRSASTAFDSRGRFPTSQTNPLAQVSSSIFDNRYGHPTGTTDANGLSVSWEYDEWGRRSRETRPDGTRTVWSYRYCSGIHGGTAACPAGVRYLVEVQPQASTGAANGPWERTYFDALERAVRTETQGFDGTAVIRQDTEYDNQGRIARTSRPYYAGQAIYWISYNYDLLGRQTRVTAADGAQTNTSYQGLTTIVTDALGRAEARTINSQGWLVSTRDAANRVLTYQYDPLGHLIRTVDPMGNSTQATYDLRGRKLTNVDPNMGTWSYTYNAIGEQIRQTDAKNQVTTFTYDLLGRTIRRNEPDLVSTWYYDRYKSGAVCNKGIGQMCEAESDNGYRRVHTFDSFGRPSSTNTTIDAVYSTSVTYDVLGRGVDSQTYPGGFTVRYVYTNLGYLSEIRNGTSNGLYWKADIVDAEGHITQLTYGSNTSTNRTYNAANGRLTAIKAAALNRVQNLTYRYDAVGNIVYRDDGTQNVAEVLTYDQRNRFTSSTIQVPLIGTTVSSYNYNDIGNITSSSIGTYAYNTSGSSSVRPHAVNEVVLAAGGKLSYQYDANGNMTQKAVFNAAGAQVPTESVATTYSSYNLPIQMQRPGALLSPAVSLSFQYGPERQRVRQQANNATTIYVHPDNVGGMQYEKRVSALGTFHIYYVSAEGAPFVQVTRLDNGLALATDYIFRDALGSVDVITDYLALVKERFSYEAFGERRRLNGTEAEGISGTFTDRGFTNHEHLDELNLIHMNGRVYDPQIARFTSADPFIQDPGNLQSFNRYSYVINNPLRYTDPSGYFFKSLERSVRHELRRWERDFRKEIRRADGNLGAVLRVAGAGASLLCGGPACIAGVVAIMEATVSRAQGVTGGDLIRNVAVATGTALAFNAVGTNAVVQETVGKQIGAHAIVGCLSATASGGHCGRGAVSAFLGKVTTVSTAGLHPGLQLASASLAAGLSSQLMGGNFSDGAVLGAYGYLFNHCASGGCTRIPEDMTRSLVDVGGKNYYEYRYKCADAACLIYQANYPASHPLNAPIESARVELAKIHAGVAISAAGPLSPIARGLGVGYSLLDAATGNFAALFPLGSSLLFAKYFRMSIGPNAGNIASSVAGTTSDMAVRNVQNRE